MTGGMTGGISVVIPMRDGARYVTAALDSIAAQDPAVARVIVVDDGSVDDGPQIAASHPLRPELVSIPPSGIGAARNCGIARVDTEFVAFLDADDLWTPDHCRLLLAALTGDSTLAMAFGHAEQFLSPDVPEETAARLHVPERPMPALVTGAMLARRAVFDRVGLFDPGIRVAEFVHWLLAAEHRGERYRVLPDVVLRRRHHGANVGRLREDDRRLDFVRVIREHLHRRRASPAGDPEP